MTTPAPALVLRFESERAIDELLANFQRACEERALAEGDAAINRTANTRNALRATLRATLVQLVAENATLPRMTQRWAVFREAVEALDRQMQIIASALAQMGGSELAGEMRRAALTMFASVQDDATGPAEQLPRSLSL